MLPDLVKTALDSEHQQQHQDGDSDAQSPEDTCAEEKANASEAQDELSPVDGPPTEQSPPNVRRSTHSAYRSTPNTPAARTGPPRSISYGYKPSHSPHASRLSNRQDGGEPATSRSASGMSDEEGFPFEGSSFRGVMDAEQKSHERENSGSERKGKSKLLEEPWNPLKWFTESPRDTPREEQREFDFAENKENGKAEPAIEEPHEESKSEGKRRDTGEAQDSPKPEDAALLSPSSKFRLQRSASSPYTRTEKGKGANVKWGRLKSMLPTVANQAPKTPGHSAVTPQAVNITDELMVGGLSTLMLRLWFERDEKDHRRIPLLFHRLRIRVSDSLHPMHGSQSVFRIECEYANGAARWVVYRQLRDFISLHTHYRVSNAYFRNVEDLPEFPKTSLPYFKFLKKERGDKGGQVGAAEFARMQREALESYLINLIRAVMFHPSSNRLAGFLEISALSIYLAQSGGSQYKAGFLQIKQSGNKGGGIGRKSVGWKEKKESRWCAVRESYLVVLEEAGSLDIWDVFLIDSDFKIERPKRYYRQGLHILHTSKGSHDGKSEDQEQGEGERRISHTSERLSTSQSHAQRSTMGSVRHRISKALHFRNHSDSHLLANGRADPSLAHSRASSSSSTSSSSSGVAPMLDPSTNTNPLETGEPGEKSHHVPDEKELKKQKKKSKDVSKHTFYIENAQMRLKMVARNERQMLQWITALEKAAATSHYTGKNRFDSFSPIRLNVAAQWLVDGRDYFWNVSRAILLARETIYIHDWWISPELQLRRPHKDKYRLDHLLERKAKEGVRIHIIVYQEVSSRTTPTESNYTKQRLTGLHPNIMVQRSPSHFQTGTFYWAHHEKMCVIDEAIAFMGGLDLCFGRWDTPQHVLIDDPESGDIDDMIWPGKDYSNPRISDFYNLAKPEESMYDRGKVPRMPWHDVAMQIVGQPARDLARHFVERWNYLLRIKNHSRVMPFLLPPPEFKPGELTELGLTGTCEMQICRSAGPWSLGTPSRIEHSIQNAYLKAIQLSEHFVYIENQFFITSTVVNEVKVENKIGDALVERIIRAHREGTPWKCCIVIPLVPGFAYPVDHSDASALRIIMECQNRTICRGPNSIYSRLRKEGIDPDDYISVFSLRNWAKLRGDTLTTEMVYIHGKVCIVDDRLAIIGSANINERSQRGDRDSELASVIRDTDMIDGKMAGKPFKVGRFAHTLRVRLMREHIGVDVDAMDDEDLMANEPVKEAHEQEEWDPDAEQKHGQEGGVTRVAKSMQRTPAGQFFKDTVLDGIEQAIHGSGDASSKSTAQFLRKIGAKSSGTDATTGDAQLDEERKTFTREGEKTRGFASSVVPTLEEKTVAEQRQPTIVEGNEPAEGEMPNGDAHNDASDGDARGSKGDALADQGTPHSGNTSASNGTTMKQAAKNDGGPAEARTAGNQLFGAPADASTVETDDQPPHARSGVEDADESEQAAVDARKLLRKHMSAKLGNKTWTLPTPTPKVDPDGFEDPVCDEFWKGVWVASAVHNTEIYRKVFHAVPDDLITTWKQYKEFVIHHERLNKPYKDDPHPDPVARVPSETADEGALGPKTHDIAEPDGAEKAAKSVHDSDAKEAKDKASKESAGDHATDSQTRLPPNGGGRATPERDPKGSQRRAARGAEPFEKWEREEMEALLGELCGHLVVYPTRFLEGEDVANNFLFNADRLLPLPIYD